ncbi:TetR/AcrR family transcriptional regulator [Halorientalis brevis]|uniref:TetR/AcrR family transcriptional regulator n=1 Tax=Halorientalis brevis TaxID=1126241 RepID=A0ABD6CBI8_9EURY|nr:TetR/AcrR family transcriptional regulator [Halorientalis brevis]
MSDETVPPDAKAEIAAAVRQALADHGYARLTTQKIAAQSEKSEAGLYYYYDSKDEMIAAFLETTTAYLAEALAADDAADPETQLRAACDRLFVSRENEEASGVNIAVMELLSHAPYNETLREPLLELEGNTLDHLEGIISAGVDQGVFREVDPRGTAAFILAAANGSTGFYLALGMDDAGNRLRDRVDAYVDSLLAADH